MVPVPAQKHVDPVDPDPDLDPQHCGRPKNFGSGTGTLLYGEALS